MTADAPLPDDLLQWVTRFLPGQPGRVTVTDVSWPRGDSRVWHVASAVSDVYVKLNPTPQDYTREVYAYQHAARSLSAGEAPRLLAADPGLRAIMTSPLRGRVVRGLHLPAQEEARVHKFAGRLLRRWHDHPEPVPAQAHDGMAASMAEQADEAAACLERTAEHLTRAQRAMVRQVSRELPYLTEGLPLVFVHGDYSPRNWLWDAERGVHGLIDFQKSAHGFAIEDLVWLCGAVWPSRPDLKSAFLGGYGRELSDVEQRALLLLTTRLAVSYLNAGLVKQEPPLVQRGQTVLGDLARAGE